MNDEKERVYSHQLNGKNMKGAELPRPFNYRWIILAASFLAMFAGGAVVYTYSLFFESLIAEFGWTRATTSAAFSIFTCAATSSGGIMGFLNDKYGPRLLLCFAAITSTLALFACTQISSIWHLYFFYGILLGIGRSPIYVISTSTVIEWFSLRKGLFVGIVVSAIGVGTTVTTPLLNTIIQKFNWQTAFATLGVINLILLFFAAVAIRRCPYHSESGSLAANKKTSEARVDVTPKEALLTKKFWILYLTFTLLSIGGMMIMVHIVPYASDIGFSDSVPSFVLAIMGGSMIIGRVCGPTLSDIIERTNVLMLLSITQTISAVLLIMTTEIWNLYLFAILFGFSFGGWAALPAPIISDLFQSSPLGTILGGLLTSISIGAIIGPITGGFAFDITHSYYMAFLLCIVCYTGALLSALALMFETKRAPVT